MNHTSSIIKEMNKIDCFLALLKDCGKKKDVLEGIRTHIEIVTRGLFVKSPHLATTLIHMYAKCGDFARAEFVLHSLPLHDVVIWNAFITGLVHHAKEVEALMCFQCMRFEGISPNVVTFICVLKACGNHLRMGEKGQQIHTEVVIKGLSETDTVLGNALVYMYTGWGLLDEAKQVVETLCIRDTVTWSTLISGYVKEGHDNDAITCFQRMQNEGLTPDAITFTFILGACGCIGALYKGKEIHEVIVYMGLLGRDAVLGNALVDMYAKCGDVVHAQKLFDELPFRSVASWTMLISGYCELEQGDEAFFLFERMKLEGISPTLITYVCVLKACSRTGELNKGKQVHNEISFKGLLEQENLILSNALVGMYATCGAFSEAQKAFDELSLRDVITWNAFISGYLQHSKCKQVFDCFEHMQIEGISPNAITFICILKACANIGAIDTGKRIHHEVMSNGFLAKHVAVSSALVDMYAQCGALSIAYQLLKDELRVSDSISWNALISAYVKHGQGGKALSCFKQMQTQGIHPDTITFACVLKAYGSIRVIERGKQTHAELVAKGWLNGKCIVLGTALVDMYAKCGGLLEAQNVFDKLTIHDSVSWNALISGYVLQGQGSNALHCFGRMQSEGFSADMITFTCILKACGTMRAIDKGEQIYDEILRKGLLGKDVILGTMLVDMYAKSGALARAKVVLDKLPIRDVVSWSTLISRYAQHGLGKEALYCFEWMQHEGISPTAMTFLSVLNACSHSGLVYEGEVNFVSMSKYGVIQDPEHYTCIVDTLGRAGHFEKAMLVIETMLTSDYPPLWGALLGACRKWGNVELGRLAFNNAIQLDKGNAAAYACMATIFAGAGMHEDAKKIEAMRVMNITSVSLAM